MVSGRHLFSICFFFQSTSSTLLAPAITNGAGVLHEAERTHSTNQNHASAKESNADSDDGDEMSL